MSIAPERIAVPPAPSRPAADRSGVVLLIGSAGCFGVSVVFAKEAYAAGVGVAALLTWRFLIAAAALWAVIAWRRPRRPSRRALLICLGLGLLGYSVQSGLYFGSLTVLDASVAALLLYSYPALVTVIAVALRREPVQVRKVVALASCAVGLLLLLGGGASATLAPRGVLFALGAAATYAVYITVADRLPSGTDLVWMTAVVCSGAAVGVGGFSAARGAALSVPAGGWPWVTLLALVSTVAAVILFFAGLRHVGGPTASILSCFEPVVSVLAGVAVYSERLGPGQLVGACGVLCAVVVLQLRPRDRRSRSPLCRRPRDGQAQDDLSIAATSR